MDKKVHKSCHILLLIASFILLFAFSSTCKAAGHGNELMQHNEYEGYWSYQTVDTKATIGFHITARSYPNGIPKRPWGTIMKSEFQKTSIPKGNSILVTFKISDTVIDRAYEKAGISVDTLKKTDGRIYFHAIIQVYNARTGKNIGKPHYTEPSIRKAASWKNPNDFMDRFNMYVQYDTVTKAPVYIRYYKWDSKSKDWRQFNGPARKMADVRLFTNYKAAMQAVTLDDGGNTYWLCRSDYNIRGKPAYRNSLAKYVQGQKYPVNSSKGIIINFRYKVYSAPKREDKNLLQLEPDLACQINSREFGHEEFESSEAIPCTEPQYIRITCQEFLFKIKKSKEFGGVKRSYCYTQITGLNVWRIHHADTLKGTFPESNIDGNSYKTQRTYYTNTQSNFKYEIHGPGYARHVLAEPKTGEDGRPVDGEDGYYQCINDYVLLVSSDGTVAVDLGTEEGAEPFRYGYSAPVTGTTGEDDDFLNIGPAEKKENTAVLYQNGFIIPRETQNADYRSDCSAYYQNLTHYLEGSMASVAEKDASFDLYKGHDCGYNTTEMEIFAPSINSDDNAERINPVTVLTPSVCDGQIQIVSGGNQLVNPPASDFPQIILDEAFSVSFPTTGWHSERKGYEERDYARYMQRREVKFPFDAYSSDKTIFYKKNTWIDMTGISKKTFYLPAWADETFADYATVKFRTTAINAPNPKKTLCEQLANASGYNYYGAYDTCSLTVSGSLFGLRLYDVSDYPFWRAVFREDNSLKRKDFSYCVGTRNRNGKPNGQDARLTFPIMEGSHKYYVNKGALKTGYVWRFTVSTIGNYTVDTDCIRITPTFYYVTLTGGRKKVDVWYNATGSDSKKSYLVKAGSKEDLSNRKSLHLGDSYVGVPDSEISRKADLTGISKDKIKSQSAETYAYGKINVGSNMKIYNGSKYLPGGILPEGVSRKKAEMSGQEWYFAYSLPSDCHICPEGTDVLEYGSSHGGIDFAEDFWIAKGGYLDINFDIKAVKGTGGNQKYYSHYYADISDCTDPIYYDWFIADGTQIWSAKTDAEASGMSEEELRKWEDLYNSYSTGEPFEDIDAALAYNASIQEGKNEVEQESSLGGESQDFSGETTSDPFLQGTPYLTYINTDAHISQGYCNMWRKEGFNRSKRDAAGHGYPLEDGDVLFCYLKGGLGQPPGNPPSPGTSSKPVSPPDNPSAGDDYRSSGTN